MASLLQRSAKMGEWKKGWGEPPLPYTTQCNANKTNPRGVGSVSV